MTHVYSKSLVNGPVKPVNGLVNYYTSLNPKKRRNALASLNSHRIYKAMRISCASMRFSLMRAHMRAFNNTGFNCQTELSMMRIKEVLNKQYELITVLQNRVI